MVNWLNGDNMVKTTLELKDEVYRKLVEASVNKYGNTKGISKIANEVIGENIKEKPASATKNKADTKKPDIVERTFGSWKLEETGAEYTKRIRKGWGIRAKRLGI